MNNEITTIADDELVGVTGGFAWLAKVGTMLGGLMGGGVNGSAQIGNNQRSATGNSAAVTVGDGSPINVTGGGQ